MARPQSEGAAFGGKEVLPDLCWGYPAGCESQCVFLYVHSLAGQLSAQHWGLRQDCGGNWKAADNGDRPCSRTLLSP